MYQQILIFAFMLLAAAILGPRYGRFSRKWESSSGHSMPLIAVGGFILVFGFLAFNAGSRVRLQNLTVI